MQAGTLKMTRGHALCNAVTAKATAEQAEYGPWLLPAAGKSFSPTDPRGVQFMQSMPDVSDGCSLEAWKSGDPQDKRAKAEYKKECAKAAKDGKPLPPPPQQPPAAGERDKPQVHMHSDKCKPHTAVWSMGCTSERASERASVRASVRACVHACVRVCVRACVCACACACVAACTQ